MARGVNKVILIGNLGQDPEVRYTPNNIAVANVTIATSESWKDKSTGENQEKTEWHRVVIWSKQAEIAGELLIANETATPNEYRGLMPISSSDFRYARRWLAPSRNPRWIGCGGA